MDSADSLLLKMLTSTCLPLTSPDFARVETSTSAEAAGEDDQTAGEGQPIFFFFANFTYFSNNHIFSSLFRIWMSFAKNLSICEPR